MCMGHIFHQMSGGNTQIKSLFPFVLSSFPFGFRFNIWSKHIIIRMTVTNDKEYTAKVTRITAKTD